ncbi:26S proteasome non-ATPase regulatory subunit 4, partial [Hypsizygus marmoreus]
EEQATTNKGFRVRRVSLELDDDYSHFYPFFLFIHATTPKMPLEATMMIIDNSEYMRNGDYQPTRFEAQSDAVNTVFQTKIDSNPENTVGIMTMAGKGPEVLVTHTKDLGQILQALHQTSTKIGGLNDIPTAIAIAQLALKHRENKNLRQRIIVFVASPLEGQGADEKSMVKLAKKLKKNNVAVDVVCYGDGIEETTEDNKSVLRAFVESASSGDNSHIISVPPGAHLLSDALISSPILSADRSSSIPAELGGTGDMPVPSGSGGAGFEFGVDPSLDPELAMALRMSMQEAQQREQAEAAAAAAAQPATSAPPAAQAPAAAAPPVTASVPAEATDDEEERLLQQALAMSEGQDVEMAEGGVDEDEDEDAAIARAIEMSMQSQQEEENKKDKK